MSILKRFRKLTLSSSLFVLAAAASSMFLVSPAHADAVYQLTSDACTGGCGPQSSFGTVNLHQVDSTTVEISVSLLNNNEFLTTGSHTGFAFNFVGGDVIVNDLPTGWADAGSGISEPAFGAFMHGIDCTKGNSNSKSGCAGSDPWTGTLDFKVSRAGGLSVPDFQNNSGGYAFATDILSGTNGKTGMVAAAVANVPEPGTLAMLGTSVLGLAGIIRRTVRS